MQIERMGLVLTGGVGDEVILRDRDPSQHTDRVLVFANSVVRRRKDHILGAVDGEVIGQGVGVTVKDVLSLVDKRL